MEIKTIIDLSFCLMIATNPIKNDAMPHIAENKAEKANLRLLKNPSPPRSPKETKSCKIKKARTK